MNRNGCRRQSFRKRDAPRKIRRPAIVVADQETTDTANRVPDAKRRSGGRERGHEGMRRRLSDHNPAPTPPEKPSEPAQSAAAQQQRKKWRLVSKFDRPNDLCAGQPAEHADERSIDAAGGQAAASELAVEYPQPDQCGEATRTPNDVTSNSPSRMNVGYIVAACFSASKP